MALLQGLNNTQYHLVENKKIKQPYHIFVRLPEELKEGELYPTVYLLDGGITFPLLASYYHYLRFAEDVPPLIIVGISYGSADFKEGNNRSTDFTARSSERDYWGGAAVFSEFLRDTLMPKIESNYASDPKQRIIFGQSIAGQFSLYAAQEEPGLFWGHIASNPALHRNLDFFLSKKSAHKQKTRKPRLFVSNGQFNDPRFREPTLKWVNFHKEQKDLPWALMSTNLEAQNHFSAVPLAFRQGLVWIFDAD